MDRSHFKTKKNRTVLNKIGKQRYLKAPSNISSYVHICIIIHASLYFFIDPEKIEKTQSESFFLKIEKIMRYDKQPILLVVFNWPLKYWLTYYFLLGNMKKQKTSGSKINTHWKISVFLLIILWTAIKAF